MAVKVAWPVKTGDDETIVFVWPGTADVGATYQCQVRANKGDTGTPLAEATPSGAVQVSTNVEVTVSLSAAQTRSLQGRKTAYYDLQQDDGEINTLFEGPVQIDLDVTI